VRQRNQGGLNLNTEEGKTSRYQPGQDASYKDYASRHRLACAHIADDSAIRPCREVLLADLADAIPAEFDNSVSLGAILFHLTGRLCQRLEALLEWRDNHFNSIASQLLREMIDEHGETDAMITAIEEFSTEKLRHELEMLTNRTITDEDVKHCKSKAIETAEYTVKCRKELEERIATEIANPEPEESLLDEPDFEESSLDTETIAGQSREPVRERRKYDSLIQQLQTTRSPVANPESAERISPEQDLKISAARHVQTNNDWDDSLPVDSDSNSQAFMRERVAELSRKVAARRRKKESGRAAALR